jgi:hypothetical protein
MQAMMNGKPRAIPERLGPRLAWRTKIGNLDGERLACPRPING